MAKAKIPDPLTRRHLVEKELPPDQARAIAEAYLADDRCLEAIDFLKLAGASEALAALRARAIANARFDGKLVQDTNEWGSQGRTPWDAWLESLNVTAYYSDHDRGERALLEREGVYTTAAKKDITAGIQTVAQLLMPQATGRPKLFIVRGARVEEDPVLLAKRLPTCLEEEFGGYHWDKRKTGILADVPRDLPVDKNNHGLDALRYAVHSHTVAGRAMAY